MSTNDDPTVQTNLAHALIKLATSDQSGVIAKVEGLSTSNFGHFVGFIQ
jgi:hypothetical protein